MGNIDRHVADAQAAFNARDVRRGLASLGEAFAIDPFDTPALQLAYAVMPQIPNLVQLTAIDDRTPASMVAIHAMALGLAHDWSRAIDLLFRLGAREPTISYLLWAENWMSTHPSAVLLDLAIVGPSMSRFADSFEDPIDKDDSSYENLTAGTNVVKRLADAFAQNLALRALHVKLLRRGKRWDEALAIASSIKQRDPHFGAMLTAWSMRDMGRPAKAIAAFREAYSFKPDVDVLLDIGDIYLDGGQFESAIEAYRQVPPNAERYEWAHPSLLCAQHLVTRDASLDAQLLALARNGNRRAQELFELVHAFAEHQPLPRDLTAGIVRDVQGMFRKGPVGTPNEPAKLDVNVSSLESPSVHVAFALACRIGRSHARIDVKPGKMTKPDVREPLVTAIGRGPDLVYQQFPVWVYDGVVPRVNAPAPPPDVAANVARLAETPFDWPSWQRMAAELGPSFRGRSGALVSALVHPAAPSDPARDPIEWVARWQLAIALVLLRIDTGWGTSERRGGLLAMVHGPVDWLTSAALPALGIVYAECPEARPELQQIFAALRQRTADIGYTCYRAALSAVSMRLPDVDENARRAAWTELTKATRKPFLG